MAPPFRSCGTEEKLELLAEAARYDVCLASCSSNSAGGTGRLRDPSNPVSKWIYPAYVPGRGRVAILKILQSNVCINNCRYCAFASSRDGLRRVTFSPDELSGLFMKFYNLGLCHGIFLSSGVGTNPEASMSRLVDTAAILRNRYRFRDYIHLKILPGSPRHLIDEAAGLANRISVNLESPAPRFLQSIAPDKRFTSELLKHMEWAAEAVKSDARAASHTTQFVVGASNESDLDILNTVDWVYRDYHVFRSYFSAYQPPDDGKNADGLPAPSSGEPLAREHRLYQTDYLLRGYGYRLPDIVFDSTNKLPIEVDPKTAHAMMHPELFPVDINTATEERLLRVPGIGPLSAKRIVYSRRSNRYRSIDELKGTGAWTRRAAPYVLFSGKREKGAQRWLFELEPPSDWSSGKTAELGEADRVSGFPGQTGKRLYYPMGRATDNIRCR